MSSKLSNDELTQAIISNNKCHQLVYLYFNIRRQTLMHRVFLFFFYILHVLKLKLKVWLCMCVCRSSGNVSGIILYILEIKLTFPRWPSEPKHTCLLNYKLLNDFMLGNETDKLIFSKTFSKNTCEISHSVSQYCLHCL